VDCFVSLAQPPSHPQQQSSSSSSSYERVVHTSFFLSLLCFVCG
jgi:hypothetical protein